MEYLLSFISNLPNYALALGIVIVGIWATRNPKQVVELVKIIFGKSKEKEAPDTSLADLVKQILSSQEQLKGHYNDTTTELLGRIEKTMNDIRDGVRDMNLKLDQIEPCRK